MAFDKISPPDLWESATARLLYGLVCAWAGDKPPEFRSFFPEQQEDREMGEAEIVGAFGFTGSR